MFTPDLTFTSQVRLDFGKLLEFNQDFYDILTSTYVTNLKNLKTAGVYRVVTERYRPDLISYNIYGQEQYKHILMLYNDMYSYRQVIPGITMIYPSLTDIENLLFTTTTHNSTGSQRVLLLGE